MSGQDVFQYPEPATPDYTSDERAEPHSYQHHYVVGHVGEDAREFGIPPSERRRTGGWKAILACGGVLAFAAMAYYGPRGISGMSRTSLVENNPLVENEAALSGKHGSSSHGHGHGHEHEHSSRKHSHSKDEHTAPHVVFIMLDDMGLNDIGYQSTDLPNATPVMTDLAEKGIKLTRYYTASSCTPARVAFLSGRYPSNVGMGYDGRGSFTAVSPYGLPLSHKLMPKHLKDIGYRTAVIGKWNVGHHEEGYLPHRRGFDYAFTFQSDEIHYYNWTVLPKLMGDYAPMDMLFGRADMPYVIPEYDRSVYTTELFTTLAVDQIELAETDDRPFFLFLAYQAVHVPHDEPPHYLFNDEDDADYLRNSSVREYRYRMAKTLIAADKSIGHIVHSLESSGMMDDTFLVVASDNGGCPSDGSNNWPFRGGKFDLYEGGVRVPAFVYSENLPKATRGTKYPFLFHAVDWLPTLLALAGSDPTNVTTDGVNHLPNFMLETSETARDEVLLGLNRWSVTNDMFIADLDFDDTRGAIISPPYKYLQQEPPRYWYDPDGDLAGNCTCGVNLNPKVNHLYNLDEDPHEAHDLTYELPEVAKIMKEKLRKYFMMAPPSAWMPMDQAVAMRIWVEDGNTIIPWHKEAALNTATNPLSNESPNPGLDFA